MLVVHSHGLALGSSLKPSKLLITNKIRLRANVVGVQDLAGGFSSPALNSSLIRIIIASVSL